MTSAVKAATMWPLLLSSNSLIPELSWKGPGISRFYYKREPFIQRVTGGST